MVQGYIYILKSELGIYKIGRTKNIDLRMKQLQGLPFKIELVHTIACEDDIKFELELHEKYKNKRKTGEWFELTDNDLEDLKKVKYVEAKSNDLITVKLSKEQHDNLFEMLQKYAEQKEGFGEACEVIINPDEVAGETITRSFKLDANVLADFLKLCTEYKQYTQRDLLSMALIEFIKKYRRK